MLSSWCLTATAMDGGLLGSSWTVGCGCNLFHCLNWRYFSLQLSGFRFSRDLCSGLGIQGAAEGRGESCRWKIFGQTCVSVKTGTPGGKYTDFLQISVCFRRCFCVDVQIKAAYFDNSKHFLYVHQVCAYLWHLQPVFKIRLFVLEFKIHSNIPNNAKCRAGLETVKSYIFVIGC